MNTIRIGLISDTHGLLRPQAQQALQGIDRIVHAGDIGKPQVLEQLGRIAPVVAIRGNNDTQAWADRLNERETLSIGGVSLYVLHDLKELDLDLQAAHFQVVVCGHSHKPSVDMRDGVLVVNPGSAGPRRFKLPVSLAFLDISNGAPHARIHLLDM
jgi:putative phosphoesterase